MLEMLEIDVNAIYPWVQRDCVVDATSHKLLTVGVIVQQTKMSVQIVCMSVTEAEVHYANPVLVRHAGQFSLVVISDHSRDDAPVIKTPGALGSICVEADHLLSGIRS